MPRIAPDETKACPRERSPKRAPEVPAGVSPTYYLADQLTGNDAIRLASRLRRLPLEQFQKVVLSLRNVTSLDASGLAILVRLYSQLVASGRQLALRDISPVIHEQLAAVGLDSVFTEKPTRGGFFRPITNRFRALGRANA